MYFEKAFRQVTTAFDRDLIYYSICLWEVGEKEKAIKILDTNIFTSNVLAPNYAFLNMPDSLKLKIKERNTQFLDKKWNEFQSASLYKLVDSLDKEDQRIRDKWRKLNDNFNGDSTEIKKCLDSVEIIDDYNLRALDSIFEKNGYLGGTNWLFTRQLRYIMIHSNEDWLLKNKKFFLSELKRGHMLPVEFAVPMDRFLYNSKNLPEFYGQYLKEIGSITAEEYFEHSNSIGLSPYFIYSDMLPKARTLPKTTPFYEYYKERKKSFNCVK
jgi:hypothetical protein